MKEIVLNVFTSVMMVLVVSALYTGITYLKKYVDETVSRLKNDERLKNNAFAQSSFYFIENFIAGLTKTAVAAMEQTKASELRERVAQGLASKEDLKALAVEAQITPLMKDELDKYILNLDSYIDERIEASVLELKRNDVK